MTVAVLVLLGIVAAAFVAVLLVFFGAAVYDAISYVHGRRRVVRDAERTLAISRHPAGKRRRP